MKSIFLICFLPIVLSKRLDAPLHDVRIDSDADCWSNEKNNTIDNYFGTLIKFSTKVAYGKDTCSVHVINPRLPERRNGFGIFLSENMDCSSILTIDCLNKEISNFSAQLSCHLGDNRMEIPCNSINIAFKRDINIKETKKPTLLQVVALAKEPCDDHDFFFQCPQDYKDSCIDRSLRCNGRSECPNGGDEYDCHRKPSDGSPFMVKSLIILAVLVFLCILSVLICWCCKTAFKKIVGRIRPKKGQKGDITVTGEDAGLIKGLTAPATIVDILPQQQQTESASLVIDSTKPIYPRLE